MSHIHTHTHTHMLTHSHTHTHACKYNHTLTHTGTHVHSHTLTHTLTHTLSHTCTHLFFTFTSTTTLLQGPAWEFAESAQRANKQMAQIASGERGGMRGMGYGVWVLVIVGVYNMCTVKVCIVELYVAVVALQFTGVLSPYPYLAGGVTKALERG